MRNIRPVWLILGVLVLVGLGVGITVKLLHKPAQQSGDPAYHVQTKGLTSTPTPLTDNTMTLIKQSVDRVVTTKHGQGTYTATYRNGSYQRMVYPNGAISMSVLIDVAETHETYKFTRTGGDNGPSTTYTHCAPDDQQMVHPSVCKDPAEGY